MQAPKTIKDTAASDRINKYDTGHKRDSGSVMASLVVQASNGCQRAEEQIFCLMRPGLINHVARLGLPEEAEDITHDAIIIALNRIRSLGIQKPEMLQAFLFQTAKNLCISLKRKQTHRRTFARSDVIDQTISDSEDVQLNVESSETSTQVRGAIASLPTPRDKTILHRVFLMEEDRSAVSASLDIKEEHLSRCLYRAKQRLRHAMEKAHTDLLEAAF
ncbi:MAG: RNA polymerase sigma factor (sigma-70 family) [Limisphaerales bacterium]|jgi:RNA polymerase sigma factor (sigma-70 family)